MNSTIQTFEILKTTVTHLKNSPSNMLSYRFANKATMVIHKQENIEATTQTYPTTKKITDQQNPTSIVPSKLLPPPHLKITDQRVSRQHFQEGMRHPYRYFSDKQASPRVFLDTNNRA
jgi:hypothetical protein